MDDTYHVVIDVRTIDIQINVTLVEIKWWNIRCEKQAPFSR